MKRWLGIVLAICLAAMPVNTYANNEQTLPTEISAEAAVNEAETEPEESAEETEESQPEESVEETEESQPEESVEETEESQPEESVEETVESQPEESVEETEESQPEESVEETEESQPEESVEETEESRPEESAEETEKSQPEEIETGLDELLTEESDMEVFASNVDGDMSIDKDWFLTEDTTITGDLIIDNGYVGINNYTLNVKGNLIQRGGRVYIQGGSLNVSGDLVQEAGYNSDLYMDYSDATITIEGSYKSCSATPGISAPYPAGTLKIGGDLIVGKGSENNFQNNSLQVILTGDGSHQISFLEENNSHIGELTVESGKITANEALSIGELHSDLEITSYSGKSFTLGALNANGHTVSVPGNVITTGDIDLAGGKLIVKGNLTQRGSCISINGGSLNVSGDLEQEAGYGSKLDMADTEDIVVIEGSYRTYSEVENGNFYYSAGTLKIGGDLIVGKGNKNNFSTKENIQVILTGDGSHQISFLEENASYIGNLTVESGKITANEALSIGKLNSDLEITGYSGKSFTLGELNANGHTVSVPGDVITKGNIDLAGGKLIVQGNLTQRDSSIYINRGSLNVSGDLEQEAGYTNALAMTTAIDIMVIEGSYKTYSDGYGISGYNDYSAGTLKIGGDLIVGKGNKDNFSTREDLQVILTGDGSHQISFLEENNSHIGSLTVESGKITANETLSIGKLNSDLEITDYSGKSFTLRQLNANGHTVSVPGGVVTAGDIDLAGGKLAAKGNLTQQGGYINVNKGVLTVSGDFVQKEGYRSELTMRNTNDIVRVEGNYATYSTAGQVMSAGELTINGNFTQGQGNSESFCATGSHITHLTGEQLQTVVFTPDGDGVYHSKFNTLYVNKDIKTGYRFTPDKCWNKLLGYEEVPEAEQQVRNFVSRMYTVALGRDAEEQGLKDWTERLMSHEVDGAGIANGFIMSDEFKKRNLSDREFVDVLYRTFFNREADGGGRANWLAALAAGKTRGYVLSGFVNSDEFDKLCDSYGIARGTMREDGSPVNPGIRNFVERCYTKVLGRAGEKAGLEDWTNRIATGQMSAEDVAKSFFFSDEYTNKRTNNEAFVETLYQTFMDRASDPAGKSDWVGRLNRGTSRQEVLEGFSRSTEFAGILQSYGL